jgi:hypothetical protein
VVMLFCHSQPPHADNWCDDIVCAFILLFCGCWHAPLSGTSGDLPPLVFLLGPRVWGYGAPVGALPSMGRCVFGLVWQILIMCGEAFFRCGVFPGSALLSWQLISAPAALRCEAPFKVSALQILLWFAPSMVLQRTVLLPFPWSYNPIHPSTPSFLGSVAT